jgi:hypothetical protein
VIFIYKVVIASRRFQLLGYNRYNNITTDLTAHCSYTACSFFLTPGHWYEKGHTRTITYVTTSLGMLDTYSIYRLPDEVLERVASYLTNAVDLINFTLVSASCMAI